MLSQINEFVLFFAVLGVFVPVIELGFRLGLRNRHESDHGAKEHIKSLQSALLGLLSLLLGFNFVMASSRFEARKALVQDEVNSIGTIWSRAQLLPAAQREDMSRLLRHYAGARIDFMKAGAHKTAIEAANAETSKIDAEIWRLTRTMVQDGTGGTQLGLFIQSLNDMVAVKWKRRSALDNHVPESVLYLLFTVAVSAVGFISYGYGLSARRQHGSTGVFALLIALVLATILDFDRPSGGFIQVSGEGLLRLAASIGK